MNDVPERPTDAQRFSRMAQRLEHNLDSTFGGAFVIVPPSGAGEPMEALILDSAGDPAQFLMLLQAKIAHALKEIEDRERSMGGMRR